MGHAGVVTSDWFQPQLNAAPGIVLPQRLYTVKRAGSSSTLVPSPSGLHRSIAPAFARYLRSIYRGVRFVAISTYE
jgi:hypothetical protein